MPISNYKNYDGVINVLDKRIDTMDKNLDGIRQDLNKTLSIRIAFGDEPPEDSLIWFDTSDK